MVSKKTDVVLASNNQGKLNEYSALLAPFSLNIIKQGDLHVDQADETGFSFVENAIIKARHACRITNLPCIADDSGLEVAALNGKPGIYSARFSGENATDEENCQLLLESLKKRQR